MLIILPGSHGEASDPAIACQAAVAHKETPAKSLRQRARPRDERHAPAGLQQ